ncbi:MAG: type I secretion C-terminal target domain-containing protein, partial [Halieaceae bacterium]
IADDVFTGKTIDPTGDGNKLEITDYDPDTGIVTYEFTLQQNQDHDAELGENDVSGQYFEDFTVELTDANDDFTSDTLSAKIIDDVPLSIDPSRAVVTNDPLGDSDIAVALDIDLDVSDNVGADQLGVLGFADPGTAATGETSGGKDIFEKVEGNVLTGYTTEDDVAANVYTVTLNQNAGTYDFNLISVIDAGIDFQVRDDNYIPDAGNYNWFTYEVADTSIPDILVTPISFDPSDKAGTKEFTGTVNLNSFELGRDNNTVDSGQGARVTFITSTGGTPISGGSGYQGGDTANHTFTDFIGGVNGAAIGFSFSGKGKTATASFEAFDAESDPANDPKDGGHDEITSVIVDGIRVFRDVSDPDYQDGDKVGPGPVTVNVNQVVTWNMDGTVTISELGDNSSVAVFTKDGYQSVEAWYVSGDGFALGDFGGTTIVGGGATLDFDLTLTDADSDTVTIVDAIHVDLTPTDTNVLNAGDDTLMGTSENDLFVWELAEQDTPSFTVTNFDPSAESDLLDLRDLLIGEEGAGDISEYLAVSEVAGSTVISVSRSGELTGDLPNDVIAGFVDHEITLEGITNATLDSLGGESIIQDMINASKLSIDS